MRVPCEYCLRDQWLAGFKRGAREGLREREREILLCPNFVGSLDAPTTAKYGAVKNMRAAASVAILRFKGNIVLIVETLRR